MIHPLRQLTALVHYRIDFLLRIDSNISRMVMSEMYLCKCPFVKQINAIFECSRTYWKLKVIT